MISGSILSPGSVRFARAAQRGRAGDPRRRRPRPASHRRRPPPAPEADGLRDHAPPVRGAARRARARRPFPRPRAAQPAAAPRPPGGLPAGVDAGARRALRGPQPAPGGVSEPALGRAAPVAGAPPGSRRDRLGGLARAPRRPARRHPRARRHPGTAPRGRGGGDDRGRSCGRSWTRCPRGACRSRRGARSRATTAFSRPSTSASRRSRRRRTTAASPTRASWSTRRTACWRCARTWNRTARSSGPARPATCSRTRPSWRRCSSARWSKAKCGRRSRRAPRATPPASASNAATPAIASASTCPSPRRWDSRSRAATGPSFRRPTCATNATPR